MTPPAKDVADRRAASRRRNLIVRIAVPVAVIIAIALGTHVVSDKSALASGPKTFSAASFGKANFAKVQAAITKRAAPAAVLATAVKANQTSAVKKYGIDVAGAPGPELCVRLTGVAGAAQDGIYTLKVAGLPASLIVRVQTGPAINGTDLRDASGLFTFGQFTNQIDYQNAASALNTELKTQVLAKVDPQNLKGKTVTLVGAFQLINPNGWLITPATMSTS